MNKEELRWIPRVALVFLLFLKGAVRGTAEREDLRGWMIVWGSWGVVSKNQSSRRGVHRLVLQGGVTGCGGLTPLCADSSDIE